MDLVVSFRVEGNPTPQGSKDYKGLRGGKPVLIESSDAKLRPWRQAVAYAGRRAMGRRGPINGPVEVSVTFRLARPRSHFGARGLLPSAPAWPAVKPDLDKLTRALGDALVQGRVLAEDSRIVHHDVWKEYATERYRPGALVTIRTIGDPS